MFEKIFTILDKNVKEYNMERKTDNNIHEYYIEIIDLNKETFDFFDKILNAEEKGINHKTKYVYFIFSEKAENGIEYFFFIRCFNYNF